MKKDRKSYRLKNWDYSSNGLYFITICTKDRAHHFGEIQEGKLEVSPCGAIANVLWSELPYRNKNISLGEFVIMPNHIHGILELNNSDHGNIDDGRNVDNGRNIGDGRNIGRVVACNDPTDIGNKPTNIVNIPNDNGNVRTKIGNKPTDIGNDLTNIKNKKMSEISPKPNTISTIIRSYKSAVTKYCNRMHLQFAWQSRFYDHIIRNEQSLIRISQYIIENPMKWQEDKFYK